jgi:PAS domain S-box-containing protein
MSESQINARASLPTAKPALDIFQGGGEVGGLMRAHNWHATALGPPETWSHPLRSALQLHLNAGHPMSIWWGPDLTCFYNDAYRELIGAERHPTSLGRSAREVWGEVWNIMGPQIEQVLAGGGATRHHNTRLTITRNGRRDDVYWTYSFSPIAEESALNGIGGVLMVCTETTEHVSAVRRAGEERERLAEIFEQASGFMALLRGPEHRIELANGGYLRLIGQRDVVGRTLIEAFPDATAAGHAEFVSTVYRTGEAYAAHGAKFAAPNIAGGQAEERYADFVYQPIKDMTGAVTGILIEGSDVTSRVLAEAALRESEARFREIADAAPVLIWISDVTKTCTWFNEPWLRFTGRAMEQETGYGWVTGVHPDDIESCVAVYNDAFDRQESYRTQYRRKRCDGEWRILNAAGVPRFAGGAFVGYIGSCYDVTDQIAAARALSESEEQLRLATEAAEVGLWDWDLVNDTVYWPPRVKAMFGISAEVPVSTADFFAGLHPEDRERIVAAFAAARDPTQRALYDVEYRTVGKEDRIVRWVAAKGRALFDGDRGVRVIGTAIDISARKAAEQQLRELNEGLEQRVADALAERKVLVDIVESTDALIQVLDLDFRIMAINRATVNEFERLYGVRPKVGDKLLDLLEDRPEHREVVKKHWSRALAGEEFTVTDEFGDPNFDGRYFEIRFNALRDRHGELVGAFQFVYDVTDRLRDQARLAEAESHIRQAQKIEALGQLTGGVAHDFNNLLMVITGGLSLLERQSDPQRRQRVIDGMRRAAERGTSLSRQLLAFSRRQPLKSEPVDLRRQIDSMQKLLDRTLRGDVHVRTALAEDLWPIKVDPAELELVIINLCVNARDAMAGGGVITISARNVPDVRQGELSGDFVLVTVADTGTGMSAEVLAHVFEPFFTTKDVGKGSGLGLPQVYGFAQQSGGSVRVNSAEGVGTTVTLMLPRTHESPALSESRQFDLDSTARRRALSGSILLVEDDDEVAALVIEMLHELGYRTTRTASAQGALGALADDRPVDLVFSDIMMPGSMNGLDLAREVKRRRPGVPVLLTSGYAGAAYRNAEAENIPVLRKPYEIDALDTALRAAIDTGLLDRHVQG